MSRTSAGLLLYRLAGRGPEVLLGHMGGPFWARKDDGAWSVPKGEHGPEEDPHDAALREFREETGSLPAPDGPDLDLGTARQSAKTVRVFARRGDLDADAVVSNTFQLELPRGSGRMVAFPEIDRARWVDLAEARRLLVRGQVVFVDRLEQALAAPPGEAPAY
ncbi:NUDIX domain-containing protein [Nakamurella endophytica]|uniref:Phosphohydrolase n=1 Tax=Nakamurella endophytica TaxID=1748367 RepID=A0A917SVR0_9ACTN|nr:NUDIX domain-containing protein [Nakamurella endophytica]GGM00010.1 phosphohydrolase [Nakamurella endophytica]